MTDDVIREALRLDFEQTADWRRSKAAEYPEDSRNLEAAALLDKLAASVETVAPDACCLWLPSGRLHGLRAAQRNVPADRFPLVARNSRGLC